MKEFGIALFCLLFIGACQNTEQPSQTGEQAPPAPQTANPQSPVDNAGSFSPPLSPGNSPSTAIITNGYWVIEFYVPADNDYNKKMANKGRWYKFNTDGTFICGQWQEQISHGSWRYGTSVFGNPTIIADAQADRLDGEWEFQTSANGAEMSWAGQKAFGVEEGAMAKAINLTSMPTKAQFGVAE